MLAETPPSLAGKQRRTVGYTNFSAIDRWFREAPRMTDTGNGVWRYLHGLNDEAVADLLRVSIPDIRPEWIAIVRRRNKWNLHNKHNKETPKKSGDALLKQRVATLEDNLAKVVLQLAEANKRLDKLWGALV